MEQEKDIELQDQEQEIEGGENVENSDINKDDPQYRGKVLMQRALEQLEKGNLEEFETDRALANEYFDKMNDEEEEMDAMYNESRNFGIIYHIIESNLPKLLESKEGNKSLRKIVKAIKSDKLLHEQFKIYNNLQPSKHIKNVDEYINEALSLSPSFDKKMVKKANEKLIHLLKEEKIDELIEIDDEKLSLYESIEYVAMNPKNLDNIDDFITAKNVIKESIEKIPLREDKNATIESYAEEVNTISENFSGELNAAEINLIKEVYKGNGEKYFNEYKTNILSRLNEMMNDSCDIETKSRLSKIYEKINENTYNKDKAIVDIADMIELQSEIEK